MARLRQVEIADIMDQEPLRCASCPTILEDHEKTYCRSCASYWEDVGNGLFDEIERPADGPERSSTMTMTPEQLREHKVLLARMGMIHTEPLGPTDMSAPEVQKRMREVIETTARVPSIFDEQNDFDLANQVRMLTRSDSGHEGVVCSARNRIFKLSAEVEELRARLGMPVPEALGRRPRTDREIVDQTNELARIALRYIGTGYEAPPGAKFYDPPMVVFTSAPAKKRGGAERPPAASRPEPRMTKAWEFACAVQELMTDTDPNDALANLDDESSSDAAGIADPQLKLEKLPAGWRSIDEFTREAKMGVQAVLCGNGQVHAASWHVGPYDRRTKQHSWELHFCDHSGAGLVPLGFRPLADLLTVESA